MHLSRPPAEGDPTGGKTPEIFSISEANAGSGGWFNSRTAARPHGQLLETFKRKCVSIFSLQLRVALAALNLKRKAACFMCSICKVTARASAKRCKVTCMNATNFVGTRADAKYILDTCAERQTLRTCGMSHVNFKARHMFLQIEIFTFRSREILLIRNLPIKACACTYKGADCGPDTCYHTRFHIR